MKLKPYYEVLNSADIGIMGIGEHNTVSNGPDNGAMNCNAAHFWNCMRHGTTVDMVNNLLSRLSTQTGNINVGAHGNSGLFETGIGQGSTYDGKKLITVWNSWEWESELSKLKDKGFAVLTIYSCDTGADDAGADLLFQMATILNRAVRARTGLTTCGRNGIGFAGGTWQTAYPGVRPTPIPKAGFSMNSNYSLHSPIKITGVLEEILISSIVSIEIKKNTKSAPAIIHGIEAQNLSYFLFSSSEIDFGGELMAIPTAMLQVSYKSKNTLKSVGFTIYNDRVLMCDNSTCGRFISDIRAMDMLRLIMGVN